MISTRLQFFGVGAAVASSLLAMSTAHALLPPTAIDIDGGPLGTLEFSGGVDGYGYYVSGLGNKVAGDPASGNIQDIGVNVANAMFDVQKTTGMLRYNIQVGANGSYIMVGALSGHVQQTSITRFKTGPLYVGYITIAPEGAPLSLSAGMLNSVEGYEYGLDWLNPSQLFTDIANVENNNAKGVELTYAKGPMTVTVEFGDGWDTNVFNFLQGAVNYAFDKNNFLYLWYGGNLSRTTGPNVTSYGTPVSEITNYVNSQLFGGLYSWTDGDLTLVPEVQYVYAKPDARAGINKYTSNFGAALFYTYYFSNTPYSVGGWVQYEKSIGSQHAWFLTPNDQAAGFAISPAWQHKELFTRVNLGFNYMLTKTSQGGYGDRGTGNFQFAGTLEAGLLF